MNLLPDEEILHTEKQSLTITTHRARYYVRRRSKRQIRSIMLEEICSVHVTYRERLFLLILGVILLSVGLINIFGSSSFVAQAGGLFALAGLVMIVVFLLLRKHHLVINSASGSIRLIINGASTQHLEKIIDTIEQAKNNRLLFAINAQTYGV